MAHYAFINSDNIVVQVISGVDEDIIQIDENGNEVGGSTEAWESFYESLPWFDSLTCKRTSYNHRIRKQYAGIGFTYDPIGDVFIAPQPFPSWSLDEDFDWQPPVAKPEGIATWDEENQEWILDENNA